MEKGFKGLTTWQKAYDLALEIYKVTRNFPRHELYGLTSQMRRAAVSVGANIAEGYERQHRKEYIQFLMMAKGSLGELEMHLMFTRDLGYFDDGVYSFIDGKRKETARLLQGLIKSLHS